MSLFVPSSVLSPESLGTIEVFGTILSTQTQSLLIALSELGIKFIHHPAMPNSPEVSQLSPFGTIPVMVHRPSAIYASKDIVCFYEMSAIAQYIDEVLNVQSSAEGKSDALMPKLADSHSGKYADSALLRAEVRQLCSVIRTYIQNVVEDQYVKPYFALRNNGASESDISVALSEQLDTAISALIYLERIIHNVQQKLSIGADADFLFGKPTWVAAHLFPILRDFRATGPKVLIGGPNERLPHLTKFLQSFENRPSAQAVLKGTFAASA